jgi:hypothetical protein
MHLSKDRLPTECWLKGIRNLQKATDFVEEWNEKVIDQLIITCKIEEDKTELCKHFQIGKCQKSDDECDWEHIQCTEYNTCSTSDCLYGHAIGVKSNRINNRTL